MQLVLYGTVLYLYCTNYQPAAPSRRARAAAVLSCTVTVRYSSLLLLYDQYRYCTVGTVQYCTRSHCYSTVQYIYMGTFTMFLAIFYFSRY